MKTGAIVLSFFLWACHAALGQQQVTGTVVDSIGQPIAGATVSANKGKLGQTDRSGRFVVQAHIGETLVFDHVGYRAREIAVAVGATDLHIVLIPVPYAIEDVQVVSTGYQTLPKERVTGSFEHIGTRDLEARVSANIIDKLEGHVAGLQYDNRTGRADINIRGINTMSDGLRGPLIVVDNFPFEGDLEDINPEDVESVTILKDAAASSIWGARAGNGVIVINLKKPMDRLQVDLSTNYTSVGKPRIKDLPQMASGDFIDVERMLFERGFYDPSYHSVNSRLNIFSPVVEMLYQNQSGSLSDEEMERHIAQLRDVDFRDQLLQYLYRKENLQQYTLSLSNGNARSGYRISAAYNRALGQKVGSSNDNVTLGVQHHIKLGDKLGISTRMNYMHTGNSYDANSFDYYFSPGAGKTNIYPYVGLIDKVSGEHQIVPYRYNTSFLDAVGQGRLLDWHLRPLDEIGLNRGWTERRRVEAQINVGYSPVPWLKLDGIYNYQTYVSRGEQLYAEESYYTRDLVNRFSQIDGGSVRYIVPLGGINRLNGQQMSSHRVRGNLAVDHDFADGHSLIAILGSEVSTATSNSDVHTAFGYDPFLMTSQAVDLVNSYPVYGGLSGNARIPASQGYSEETRRYVSFFGNAAYTYDKKYTWSFSARKDASNLFGVKTNERWNPLWSTGLAWSLGKERFFEKLGWMHSLRLRATYGHSGNSGGISTSLPRISHESGTSTSLTSLPRARVSDLPNPVLKWEDVRMINIALDFALFENVLDGSVEYFNKKSTDLLSTDNIDPTVGFSSVRRNVGVLEGKGWDIRLTARQSWRDLSLASTVFLSMGRDVVKEYRGNVSRANVYVANAGRNFQIVPDKQLYPVFALPFKGLDPENGDPQGWLNGELSKDYLNLSRDSLQNIVYFGTALPPYHGSFKQSVGWKNLNVSVLISYKFGHYFQRQTIRYGALFNSWDGHPDFEKRWQVPGDEVFTTVPSMTYPANTNRDNFYAYSETNIEKGDLVRLQDINVSYTFRPGRHRIVGSVSAFAAVNNVGILWRANREGLDPDYFNIPPSRRFSLGLTCKF